jgi:hypothetical protein
MSIAPITALEDISLEAALPENDIKSAKPVLGDVPSKPAGKSRFVLYAVIAATMGVGLVLGLSLGLTGKESNSQSSAVSNSDPASTNESPTVVKEVKNYICELANRIPTDGTIILGQSTTLSPDRALEDVPACFEGADTVGAWHSSWYSVIACVSGEMTATFSDVYTPTLNTPSSAFDTRVSAYEGSCGDELACTGTVAMENGGLGSATWTAVKGKTYRLRVQHMPGTNFGVMVTYKRTASNSNTIFDILLNNGILVDDPVVVDVIPVNDVCANADPIPVETVVVGNAGRELSEDLPVCQEGRNLAADGGWYTVQADKTGPMVAEFFAFYTHFDINDFISVYEGSCENGDDVTCVGGTYTYDGTYGYYTWDAVEGVEYKIVVHSTGPFSIDVASL